MAVAMDALLESFTVIYMSYFIPQAETVPHTIRGLFIYLLAKSVQAGYFRSPLRLSFAVSMLATSCNDIPEHINSSIRLYADDALLYREIHSLENSRILQEDINRLQTIMGQLLDDEPIKCVEGNK